MLLNNQRPTWHVGKPLTEHLQTYTYIRYTSLHQNTTCNTNSSIIKTDVLNPCPPRFPPADDQWTLSGESPPPQVTRCKEHTDPTPRRHQEDTRASELSCHSLPKVNLWSPPPSAHLPHPFPIPELETSRDSHAVQLLGRQCHLKTVCKNLAPYQI